MEVRRLAFAACLMLAAALRGGNLDELFLDDQAALTGGAVIAAGSEPGSAIYNPAGLAQIRRPTLNLDASAYAARYYHIAKLVDVKLPDGEGSIQLDTSSFFSTPSSLVYGARLGKSLAGAFGIFTRNQLDALSVNSNVFHGVIPASGEPYTYEQGAELDLRVKTYSAGPALAWEAAPWLRLGMGLFGTYERQAQVNRFTGDYYKDLSLDPNGFYSYRLTSRLDQRVGISAYSLEGDLGAQLELPGRWSLGLALHSPKFRVYEALDINIILDGNATTPVANTPSGIVLHYNFNGSGVGHPYIWENAYRGYAGLAKTFRGGYVALESDFSDLPAEKGTGAVFNYRLGWQQEFAERWAFGGGIYSDLKPSAASALTNFGQTAIDYYGATLGLRHYHDYLAREKNDAQAPLKGMRMTTTLSLNYVRGSGDYAGARTDPMQPLAALPVALSPFSSDEFSAHLGGGFAF
jgi:hypothetical protein